MATSKGKIKLIKYKNILKINLTFNTSSGASDFVLGGSTNGWVEWNNIYGRTLDELIRKNSEGKNNE